MIAKRLDNIDVLCADVEPMRAFYGEVLGPAATAPLRTRPGVGRVPRRRRRHLPDREGSGPHPPHPPPRFSGAANPPGIDSFAFEVDRLDDAIAELDARGVPWAGEIIESEWYRYRGLHDPEGNLVYLTEPLLDRREPPVPAPEHEP